MILEYKWITNTLIKNYSRSVFTQNGEWSKGKTKSYWSIYSEQDSKNQPVQIDLNEQDIEKLPSTDTIRKESSA